MIQIQTVANPICTINLLDEKGGLIRKTCQNIAFLISWLFL
jgi:hypothetical protein